MEPKIELYRTRTFSEKISDSFAFIRESWRTILKFFTYLLLPVSIVMAFFMDGFMSSYMRNVMGVMDGTAVDNTADLVSFGLTTLGLLVVSAVASVLLTALVYALFRLYDRRGELRLQQLSMAELKPELLLMVRRTLVLLLTGIAIALLVGLLLVATVFLLVSIVPIFGLLLLPLIYIALLAVAMPLMLVVPIYLLEDGIPVLEAYQKAWRLGFQTWGGLFAVLFVLGLIGGILQSFTSLPWTVMLVAKSIFTLQGETGGFMNSVGYSFLQYLLCIVECYFALLASVLTFVGLTIQYGHASDKIDGVGVAQNIEKFDELDSF